MPDGRETKGERGNGHMIDDLRRGGLNDPRVEAAFRAVPRHRFLPGLPLAEVYRDDAIVTHRDAAGVPISSSSQPALMALMLEQLAVRPGMAVLEIGAGTGYNAALLGHLAGPGGTVVTVDIDPAVTGPAAHHLDDAGFSNVTVVTADAWSPGVARGPFDRIEATVAVWDLAPAWVEQLKPGGVLVVPLCLRAGEQASLAFRKSGAQLAGASLQPLGSSVVPSLSGPGTDVAANGADCARVRIAVAPTARETAAKPRINRRIVVGETTINAIKGLFGFVELVR